ncbi:MAG: alpha/beta fold hydrolase [Dehalococcoidia bacterium]
MPNATINGFEMYYEDHSPEKEEAFLLIMGFTANATAWRNHFPILSQRFRVVAFDNRGAGRSGVPDGDAYTMPQMADDAMALLDHLGIERAHVWGVSMGGMIAQEVALRHPQRVITLVLGCTTPGGERHVPQAEADQLAFMKLTTMGAEDAILAGLPLLYGERFLAANRERVIDEAKALMDLRAKPQGMARQMAGIMTHDTLERLPSIRIPTLVCTGDADRVVNCANSRLLAEAIPGAQIVEYPGAGHGYLHEALEEDTRRVMEFAAQHSLASAGA